MGFRFRKHYMIYQIKEDKGELSPKILLGAPITKALGGGGGNLPKGEVILLYTFGKLTCPSFYRQECFVQFLRVSFENVYAPNTSMYR